jgi:cytochrome c-type biogenesis protein CcmH
MLTRSYLRTSRFFFPVLAIAAIVLILAIAIPSVAAQSPGEFSVKEAQNIDRMLMCPVCPSQTIDQAHVEVSSQMQVLVREMLADGKSRGEILDFFVARYGPDILAFPPKSGANLLAWILPIAGVAAALVAVYFVIRSMTARGGGQRPVSIGPNLDRSLDPYLEMVDQQLSSNRPVAAASSTHKIDVRNVGVEDAGGTPEVPERADTDG